MPDQIVYDWVNGAPECAWDCMVRGIEEAKACPDYNSPDCFCAPEALGELGRNYDSVAECLKRSCELEDDHRRSDWRKLCKERRENPAVTERGRSTTWSTDLAITTREGVTTSPSTNVGPDTTFATSTARDDPDSEGDPDSDSDLSALAITGITIGALVVVGLLVAFLLRRSIRRLLGKDAANANHPEDPRVPELEGGTSLPNVYSDGKTDPYMPELNSGPLGVSQVKPVGADGGGPPRLSETDGMSMVGGVLSPGRASDKGHVTGTAGSHEPVVLDGSNSRSGTPGTPAQAGNIASPEDSIARGPVQTVLPTDAESAGTGANTKDNHRSIDAAVENLPELGSADELSRLAEMEKELEEKQKTLEEIMHIQEQRAALRERRKILESEEGS